MLCSVVNGDPPTALTSGLLNTAATGDTTIAGSTSSYGHTSQTMADMPQTVYVGMTSSDNLPDNIKIFKYDLTLACMATSGYSNGRALVIKGPGKVFAGSESTTNRLLYTITHAAGTYTMTLSSRIQSITGEQACGDEDVNNNYAYVMSTMRIVQINKIDMTTGVETSPVIIADINYCAAGPSVNYVVIVTGRRKMQIRLRTDMSDVGTAIRSGGPEGKAGITTIDNLNAACCTTFLEMHIRSSKLT